MEAKFRLRVVALAACLCLSHTAAASILTAGPSDVDGTVFGEFDLGWTIGSVENPIPIGYDPSAGPWIKTLSTGGLSVAQDSILTVTEYIRVGPGPDWYDWHEEIQTPNWNWISGQITVLFNPGPASGFGDVFPAFAGLGTPEIWFEFPALAVDSVIRITKYIQYVGANPFQGSIQLAEYPTVPLPAAVWLFASGLAGIWLTRRHAAR